MLGLCDVSLALWHGRPRTVYFVALPPNVSRQLSLKRPDFYSLRVHDCASRVHAFANCQVSSLRSLRTAIVSVLLLPLVKHFTSVSLVLAIALLGFVNVLHSHTPFSLSVLFRRTPRGQSANDAYPRMHARLSFRRLKISNGIDRLDFRCRSAASARDSPSCRGGAWDHPV